MINHNKPYGVYGTLHHLLGGTPFKEAVKLSMSSDKEISVTCGCNVGSMYGSWITII